MLCFESTIVAEGIAFSVKSYQVQLDRWTQRCRPNTLPKGASREPNAGVGGGGALLCFQSTITAGGIASSAKSYQVQLGSWTQHYWVAPSAHVALDLPAYVLADQAHTLCLSSCPGAWHTTKHTWRQGSLPGGWPPQHIRGTWVTPGDTWHLGFALDPWFLSPRILNIIICYRNIIIFSIINVINKIINKFERKYYY